MTTGYKGDAMRRLIIIFNLIFVSIFCFAQQNIPGKIIGRIPDAYSQKTYQIQVGAFKLPANAENVMLRLQKNALNPVSEKYLDFTRVLVKGIPANQTMNFLAVIKQAGFNEVIIREDTVSAISEKWEIITPGSAYSSFEFNHNRHYIAVENDEINSVHFGEYNMPQKDVISLEKLGTVRINNDSQTGIDFSFSSAEEPGREIRYTAAKAEVMKSSPKLDLLCRTWKVVNCTDSDNIGFSLLISNAGTYFFAEPDGASRSLSGWRWYDEKMDEFEYTHDNWEHYGRAKIIRLTVNSLEVFDPGFSRLVRGYSDGGLNDYWELVPWEQVP